VYVYLSHHSLLWLDYAGEGQQKFTQPTDRPKSVGRESWIGTRQLQSVVSREQGSGGISIFRRCYLATSSEDMTDWDELVCGVTICACVG
jgi:hypothetical protein